MKKNEKFLTKEKFIEICDSLKNNGDIHWKTNVNNSRWEYHEKTINLLKNIEFNSILEIGTMNIKVYDNSDTLDYDLPNRGWQLHYQPTYNHNLKILPWCVSDNKYDVVVALRVFHHLLDNPNIYFNELKRIAKHIILAFPKNVADIYKKIQQPTREILCVDTDTVILYYNLDKNIINTGVTSKVIKLNNLIHKTVNYGELTEELIVREIYWLLKLENYNITPKFIKRDNNTIIMSYCGEPITKNDLNNVNILKQFILINKILLENYCYYNDFKLDNFLLLNDKLYVIDFGWCPLIKEDYTINNTTKSDLKSKPSGNWYTLFNSLI